MPGFICKGLIRIHLFRYSFLLLLLPGIINAQSRPDIKKILEEFGSTARAYLLSVNRPSYNVSAYTTEKKHLSIDAGIVFNNEIYEFPFDIAYGITDRFEIFGGIAVYTQSYNFSGTKIGGVGDGHIGVRYRFQESEHFMHAFQSALKIPFASSATGLGTGLVDFHFGFAEAFGYKKFSYDLSAEIDFLRRRNFPYIREDLPKVLKEIVDSLKQSYNYKYEPEFVVSISPGFEISRKVFVYSGVSFSRNFRLDYNSAQVFTGFGFAVTRKMSLSFGGSYGLTKSSGWILSMGFSILI